MPNYPVDIIMTFLLIALLEGLLLAKPHLAKKIHRIISPLWESHWAETKRGKHIASGCTLLFIVSFIVGINLAPEITGAIFIYSVAVVFVVALAYYSLAGLHIMLVSLLPDDFKRLKKELKEAKNFKDRLFLLFWSLFPVFLFFIVLGAANSSLILVFYGLKSLF